MIRPGKPIKPMPIFRVTSTTRINHLVRGRCVFALRTVATSRGFRWETWGPVFR